jgi:cytochrome P450 / NADPH-cytochrome P450 reductase
MDAVIKETLRLSPRVLTRICTKSTKIGNVFMEEGNGIQVDILSLHRDKRVWGQNAEEFVPERFKIVKN